MLTVSISGADGCRIPALRGPHFPQCNVTGGPKWRVFSSFLHQYCLLRIIWYISGTIGFPWWVPMPRRRCDCPRSPASATVSSLSKIFARVNVNVEAIRQEHWDGVSEYARYLAKLKANPSLSFTIRAASSMKAVSN